MLLSKTTLKQRLILISILTTGAALLLASSTMFVSQLISLRDSLVKDLTIKAEVIGKQCAAALMFNVPADAGETLSALQVDPQISYAAVYTRQGELFAEYRDPKTAEARSQPFQGNGYRFGMNHIDIARPIMVQHEQAGSIFIRSGLQRLHALLLRFLAAAGLTLVISLLAAYALMLRLQGTVTKPVNDLVRVMEQISRERDLSVRAGISGPEELSSLARGFNDMLLMIQERDQELEQQRYNLERSMENLRRSSAELREANRKLETLDKMKSDFISVVSHELRTPLTAIKAFVELLIMKQGMPLEKKGKLLQVVNEESDRLGRLINDLLDLTRIESGTMNWRNEEFSINDAVQTSLNMLMPAAQKKGQHFSASLDSSLPQLLGDRDRMVQVATNILSNAIKFTPDGGAITVRTAWEASKSQIVVSVSDTGMGIPAGEIERVFDKFHRSGDVLTNNVEGTGLGLSIAREIVEHHGGRIWATSRQGSCTTLTFTVPVRIQEG